MACVSYPNGQEDESRGPGVQSYLGLFRVCYQSGRHDTLSQKYNFEWKINK